MSKIRKKIKQSKQINIKNASHYKIKLVIFPLHIYTLHEKQHFRKNARRKYHIFVIFRNRRKYHIFRKTKIKENAMFSIISDIFRNKSIKQDNEKKEKKMIRRLNTVPCR